MLPFASKLNMPASLNIVIISLNIPVDDIADELAKIFLKSIAIPE